ncbi:MAG TPA: lysoplasmalogenase [Chitinophagaceae bacterium]|nr:lysoplasmalogenase [Chitinophagaceae bacterium]
MKINTWVFLFFCVLVADILLIQLQEQQLQFAAKPLLIPLLGFYFYSQTDTTAFPWLRKWTIISLFFSWTGDVLLMFQNRNEIFFLAGLSAFLLAHVFYIVVFHQIWVKENIKRNLWFLFIIVLYYAVLIGWLSPYLGDKKLPVRIYGLVISFMFLLAMHMLYIHNKIAGKLMMIGALLFVISDSALAINKFYQSFEYADIIIMLTYGFAQFLIVTGLIRYLKQANSN